MSTKALSRLSAISAMIGGAGFAILEIVVALIYPEDRVLSQRYAGLGLGVIEVVEVVMLIVLLLGLVGLYIHQSDSSGRFGLIGFLVAFIGTAWSLGEVWTSAFLFPGMSADVPQYLNSLITAPPPLAAVGVMLGFILFPLGWILFSVATIRARVFPRSAGIIIIAGVLLIPFFAVGAYLLLGAGWVWWGFTLYVAEQ